MKRYLVIGSLLLAGCGEKSSSESLRKIDALEMRIAELEKKAVGAPKEIRAQRFVIVDADGRELGTWDGFDEGSVLRVGNGTASGNIMLNGGNEPSVHILVKDKGLTWQAPTKP